MQFHKVELLEWLKLLPEQDVNLATSGMPGPATMRDMFLDPAEVPLQGANSYGYAPLKEELARMFGVTPDNVAITPGTSGANFALFSALTGRIPRVVVERPVYEPFIRFPRDLAFGNLLQFERRWEDDFRLPLDELKGFRGNPFLLMVTNLHNPSGKAETSENLRQAAEIVAEGGGWMVIDEVFLPFLEGWEARQGVRLHECILTTGSLTKSWGFGSARIGWVIGDARIVKEVRVTMDNFHAVQPFVSEFLGHQFLTHPQLAPAYLAKARRVAAANVEIVIDALAETGLFEWMKPDGGISMWVRFKDGRKTGEFCERLLREKKTLVIPGYYFGDETGFRISFGIELEKLRKGLRNIAEVAKG